MFRKKRGETMKAGQGTGGDDGDADISAPPLKPFTRKGTHAPSKPPAAASFHPDIPRRSPPEIPGILPRRAERSLTGSQDSKRLMISRDIILSGEITSCDRLVVEGRAEVAIEGADIIEVTPSGFFKGSADVEEAEAVAVEQHLDLVGVVDIVAGEGEEQVLRRAGERRGNHAVGVGLPVEPVAVLASLGGAGGQRYVRRRGR